jgi:hypothetical protein
MASGNHAMRRFLVRATSIRIKVEAFGIALSVLLLLGSVGDTRAAAITEEDSTQPRGFAEGRRNDRGQALDPIVEGFRSPAYWAKDQADQYEDWAGSMMANATRDPAFYAAVSIANRDLIQLINSLPGEPDDPASELGAFLEQNKLAGDIRRAPDGTLQPEALLPVAADLCLRCHSPVGWMEAHSEPPTQHAPFLKGQFWGGRFLMNPVDRAGKPRPVDLAVESETELDGIDCEFCHRVNDNPKRKSLHDGSEMSRGNGGFFVDRSTPFCERLEGSVTCGDIEPEHELLAEGHFCGSCHDVTNPLLKTKTEVDGKTPDMQHPIERTYTEWYWSGVRDEQTCQDCHEPVTFQGAQTWMIDPVLSLLWGDPDQVWREKPYSYDVPKRLDSLKLAASRNRAFMKEAAEIEFVEAPATARAGEHTTVRVKVTNKTGHKLPTGFSEGRQMWIHLKAVDPSGRVIFEDGVLKDGSLVRTPETKVYEQVALATGFPFLDQNGDGEVDEHERHFHFVLMNDIQKDNRIPPKGFNKAAYTADGAFIIPRDPKDTDYADGQNWDVTPYPLTIPDGTQGAIRVTATLRYQTFNREYVEFLAHHDHEKTAACGGHARDLPSTGPYGGDCDRYPTWGRALHDLWRKADMGPPVEVGTATIEIQVGGEAASDRQPNPDAPAEGISAARR